MLQILVVVVVQKRVPNPASGDHSLARGHDGHQLFCQQTIRARPQAFCPLWLARCGVSILEEEVQMFGFNPMTQWEIEFHIWATNCTLV